MSKTYAKAYYTVIDDLDERGRVIYENEFRWIMNYFKDRYDPRRLAIALCYTSGIRMKDAIECQFSWFTEGYKTMQMAQCKPKGTFRDNHIQFRRKPRFVPIPDWLATDLQYFAQYRLMVGHFHGVDLQKGRMWPRLTKSNINELFVKLRKSHAKDAPWLLDKIQKITAYDKEGTYLWHQFRYRVAPHAGRANYVTKANIECDGDLMSTKFCSGHDRVKDVEKYIRRDGIMDLKEAIKAKHMDGLICEQTIPITRDQKLLSSFC